MGDTERGEFSSNLPRVTLSPYPLKYPHFPFLYISTTLLSYGSRQILIVLSRLLLARVRPSGLMATAVTTLACPVKE